MQEQVICDTHTRVAKFGAIQSTNTDDIAALQDGSNELSRIYVNLAATSSNTFRSLQSSVQSNAQAISETNANVDNLRQATNTKRDLLLLSRT